MAGLAGELLELDPERLLQGGWHGQALLALWVEPQHFGFDRCATASRDAGAGGVGLPVGQLALVQLRWVGAEHDHAAQASQYAQ